ncbi:hypothetical protein ACLOJK_035565 [Asimina triloba]
MPQVSHLSSAAAKEHGGYLSEILSLIKPFFGVIAHMMSYYFFVVGQSTESKLVLLDPLRWGNAYDNSNGISFRVQSTKMFSSCGEILEIRIMKDQLGTPKGFCFVRFATKDAALRAQKEKDGYVLQGKKLGVQLSSDQDSLFLGNLCKDWSFEEFDKLVRQAFQDILSVDLAMSSKTGEPVDRRRQNRGFAFVQFSSHAFLFIIPTSILSPLYLSPFSFLSLSYLPIPVSLHNPHLYSLSLVSFSIQFELLLLSYLALFNFNMSLSSLPVWNLSPVNFGLALLGTFTGIFSADIVVIAKLKAAARAHRVGSKQDFLLGDKCHPVVDWAEKEPEIDPDELAKIKVAFVGNLPKNVDEGYLKKLFEPFGRLEKVALSRKGHFPVGFIHFAKRSVSIARPVEKDRKRARDESQSKTTSRSGSRPASSKDDYTQDFVDDHKLKAPRLGHSREVPEAVDPYEKAVASLPSPLVERLLQIFRLGIATRYDIDIKLIVGLEELPLSAAISVLDQFMLTCADAYDKGRDLARLIAKVNNAELNRKSLHLPERTRDFALREAELPSLPGRDRMPAIDEVVLRSTGSGSAATMYERYTPSPRRYSYSTLVQDDPYPVKSGVERISETRLKACVGQMSEAGSLSYRTTALSGYGSSLESESYRATIDHPPERPQMKYDPFTGEPYRFDPFTGEPIRPESINRRSGSRY